MSGFIFPNETEILWSVLIILYPYITGLVAGAFIVSALYQVFDIKQLKSVARLSLLTALAFLFVAPLPLLFHLGQPLRALEIFITPQANSAMAGFGVIYIIYLIILISEIWFEFRRDMIMRAISGKGLKKILYTVMTLGALDLDEKAFLTDKKIIKTLSVLGIPTAVILHGYVGFLFGGIKASPWWATPLMPVIFLMSAIVSGTALLFLLYVISTKLRHKKLDYSTTNSLLNWLFGFLLIDLSFEFLELIFMRYEANESWPFVLMMLTEKIPIQFFGIQLIAGGLVSLILIGLVLLIKVKSTTKVMVGILSSILISIGVFAMRYNVVIGGQILSKSIRGFVDYNPELWGKEGLLVAVALMIFPYVLLVIFSYILPPWEDHLSITSETGSNAPENI